MVQFTSNEGMSNDMIVNQRLTTTQGTTSLTLFEKCVGSLTSHRIYDICKTCETGRTVYLPYRGWILWGGCRKLAPPPPLPRPNDRAPDNWYSAKYSDMYDMYSQQFSLCYCLVKRCLLRICFQICLCHQSVTPSVVHPS